MRRPSGKGEVRWKLEPRDGGVYVSLERRGTGYTDGVLSRTISVSRILDGGSMLTYLIGGERRSSAKNLVDNFWQFWDHEVDD